MYNYDNEYEENRYKEIFMAMMDDYGLKIQLDGKHDLSYWIYQHSNDFENMHCKVCCGATKLCIILDEPDLDWVMKIGTYCEGWREDWGTIEYHNYIYATEENLEEYFAAMRLLQEMDGIVAYLQEYAPPDENNIEYSWDEYSRTSGCEPDDFDDEDRVRAVFNDSHELEQLVKFIRTYDINDLHEANYGWTIHGWVIIDYSGF